MGVATLSFGFKLDGGSTSAGVLATALAYGFVPLALVAMPTAMAEGEVERTSATP